MQHPEAVSMAAEGDAGSTSERTKEPDTPVDEGKRTFLKVAVVASGLLAAGAAGSILRSVISPSSATQSPSGLKFPRLKVTNLTDLAVGVPIFFDYPLVEGTPNVLVKLGQPATSGVGPDRDIVAFSQICQHLGCIWQFLPTGSSPPCSLSYKATEPVGYCCCHGSVFDVTNAARVIGGPSPRPQPQVILELDASGAIYAVGMGAPTIFGHNTGSNDVSADLQGGTLVG